MVSFRSNLLSTTKEALRAHEVKPTKGLGQNFLIDQGAIKKLVEAANIQAQDTILEIGPGIGVLTKELAARAKKVVAVEKDKRMVDIVKELLQGQDNVEIIHEDALKLQTPAVQYKIVANLPYYITAPTIRKFLEAEQTPESLTLIIQKEVAQRICAKPPNMSILAVSVQFYATAKIVSSIKKVSFWPQPKVDSAIIHIVPHKEHISVEPKKFFQVVKAGFSHPRRQVLNNLSGGLQIEKGKITTVLEKNNIKPQQRAETLSIQDWINLAKEI